MKHPETRPELLLREMTALYPGVWRFIEQCRRDRGTAAFAQDWPDWCYCPVAASLAWVFRNLPPGRPDISALHPGEWIRRMDDTRLLAALAPWRKTKGVYRFDADFARALLAAPLDGRVPVETLYRLPEWCVYIEAPPSWPVDAVAGFFCHLERDANTGRSECRLVYDRADGETGLVALHMHGETIEEMVQSFLDEGTRQARIDFNLPDNFAPPLDGATLADRMRVADCLNLVLHLCGDDAEYRGGRRPRRPDLVKTRRGGRIFAPERARIWEVGCADGARLRRLRAFLADQAGQGGGDDE